MPRFQFNVTLGAMKAVILAGGGGTRLWPLSTEEKPKQFQKLVSDKTMLEDTLDRLDFLSPEDIFIAINEKHFNLVRELCPKIPAENLIIEPALRDTASCIGYAASIVESRSPNEVMAIIYADHLIKEKEEFKKKLLLAEEIAKNENTINIIEVPAKTPHTGYGYVKLGQLIDSEKQIFALDSFKEKPDQKTAENFIQSGDYLWNTGLYVWKTTTILQKYEALLPETYQKFQQMIQNPGDVPHIYPTLEKISIDYAIIENIDPSEVRILKADLGWSDIGNWEAIWEELAQNPEENIIRGPGKLLDCKRCLVYADNGKEVRAVGLEDMVVIDTPEGNLCCHKKDSVRVKDV
jgi:mannose-1-phosphate guanylyltransferase